MFRNGLNCFPRLWIPRLCLIICSILVSLNIPHVNAQQPDKRPSQLRVHPGNASVPVNARVAFVATLESPSDNRALARSATWQVHSLTRKGRATISEDGRFVAERPGSYRVSAVAGNASGEVVVTVAGGRARKPNERLISSTNVSSSAVSGSAPPALPPPISSGPGWQDSNYRNAYAFENRRGDHVVSRQGRPATGMFRSLAVGNETTTTTTARTLMTGAGQNNYLLTVPVLSLPGRGIGVELNLFYNANVWTVISVGSGPARRPSLQLAYDHDKGWPAPGWSLGFGKAIRLGSIGLVIQDADGTLHPFAGEVFLKAGFTEFKCHTTDGTLIDGEFELWSSGALISGTARYPNGTMVVYGAAKDGALYPTEIIDANANYITIAYRNNAGPQIELIADALGRVVNFDYDDNGRLISVTAPDLNGGTRAVLRLHYHTMALNYSTEGMGPYFPVAASPRSGQEIVLVDGIFFPSTSTGYWFADSDSYVPLGILTKVSQRRSMSFWAADSHVQGMLTAGVMTRERVYDFQRSSTLLDIPTYRSVSETWDGMTVPAAVTWHSVNLKSPPLYMETKFPDGTTFTQYVGSTQSNSYDDGLVKEEVTSDPSGATKQVAIDRKIIGNYGGPLITGRTETDELGQTLSTQYRYAGPTDGVADIIQSDYPTSDFGLGVSSIDTHIDYETTPQYLSRHIFNLPSMVTVREIGGPIVSRTAYEHDHQPLAPTPNLTHNAPLWLGANIELRGNLTRIKRYADAVNATDAIVEDRRYDNAGNLVAVSGCCGQVQYGYTAATDYMYPSTTVAGSSSDVTKQLRTTMTYDMGTGLPLVSTDANGRPMTYAYYPGSLRLKQVTLPSGATSSVTYDDGAMTNTATLLDANGAVALGVMQYFDGFGNMTSSRVLLDGNSWSDIETIYDALGHISKQSKQHFVGTHTPLLWSVLTYGAFGRIASLQEPDGSKTSFYYNEKVRPSSASQDGGQTSRVVDPAGRERWYRTRAFGLLAEVVEPNANGTGLLSEPGSAKTTYTYNPLGLLTGVSQGPDLQIRNFDYDSLGRLRAQYLPERRRSLDDAGNYVTGRGLMGKWSDVFGYDAQNNLASHVDARGVKTIFDFGGDPLNRLRSVTYDLTDARDPAGPVAAVPPEHRAYMTSGDVTRPRQITLGDTGSVSFTEDFAYLDPNGRLTSVTNSFSDLKAYPFSLDFSYDSLGRVSGKTYPAEYGVSSAARRALRYHYNLGGLSEVDLDGVPLASAIARNTAAAQITSILIGPVGKPGSSTETYSYDPGTLLLSGQQVTIGTARAMDLGYSYFPDGALRRIVDNLNAGNNNAYRYDGRGRLHVVEGAPLEGQAWAQEYSYDSYGNRTTVATHGRIAVDGLASLNFDGGTNHITSPGFAYDAAGNLIQSQLPDGRSRYFRYDAAGHLQSVSGDASGANPLESYFYGPEGRRLTTQIQGGSVSYFIWDGTQVIAEYSPKWSSDTVYFGGRVLARIQPSGPGSVATVYPHPDRSMTRSVFTTDSGTAPSPQATLPYGNLIAGGGSAVAPATNPVFTTYDRSTLTGLDYAVHRYYDALQGRFSQADPIGMGAVSLKDPQTLNAYTYAGNDPVNSGDPSGLLGDETCVDNGDGTSTCTGGVLPADAGVIRDNTTDEQIGDPFFVTSVTLINPGPPSSDAGTAAPDLNSSPVVLPPGPLSPPQSNSSGRGRTGGSASTVQRPNLLGQRTRAQKCSEYKAAYARAYANGAKANEPILKATAKFYAGVALTGTAAGVLADAASDGQTVLTGLSSVDAQVASRLAQNTSLLKAWTGASIALGLAYFDPYSAFAEAFAPDATDFASFQTNFQLAINPPAVCQEQ
jgi:RHS repeat-associated protein